MIYIWYFMFNLDEFNALGLVSRTYTLTLENIGQKDVLLTKGNYIGITYEGIFLPLNQTEKNPFEFDDQAIYVDEDQNVWLGFLQGDS